MLEKKKIHVFGKDAYLLGKDSEGVKHWLESPSWDCGWYWGFGYVETYTNNRNPEMSKDISSHSLFNGLIGQQYKYDFDKHCEVKGEFIYHINDKNSSLVETTLTDKESWELSDLMKRFYILREMADVLKNGTANYTSDTQHKTANDDFRKWINEEELPKLFKRVIEILSPTK